MGNNVQGEYVAAIFSSVRTNSATRIEALDCSGTLTPVLHPIWRHSEQNCGIERFMKIPNFTM